MTESLPMKGDPRDALFREHAGQIAALTALVAAMRWRKADEVVDHFPEHPTPSTG